MIPESTNCFVTLSGGSRKDFPTATEVRERDGGIEILNDRIFLDGFKKGQYRAYWIDPQVALARQVALGLKKKPRRQKRSRR